MSRCATNAQRPYLQGPVQSLVERKYNKSQCCALARREEMGRRTRSYALRRFGAGSAFLVRRVTKSRGKAPLHRALTQSSHRAIASRGFKSVGLKLNSTQSPSSSADSTIAAGRSLKGGAAPEFTSWPSSDSRTERYLP